MASQYYTKDFYEQRRGGSARSAEIILPLVLGVIPVQSVVDVGCGDGNWLAVLRTMGVKDVLGIDGEYLDPGLLQIPVECFRACDLRKPLDLQRTFDLAISLEVAEHLPEDNAATFVESLVRIAPCVLFSAAIPFQGGVNHINEQWPDKWAGHFREHGYHPVDFIRRMVWKNEDVDWWYAQNTLLFARLDMIEGNRALKVEFERTNASQLSVVHPRQLLRSQEVKEEAVARAMRPPSGVLAASRMLVSCLGNSVKAKFALLFRKTPSNPEGVKSIDSRLERD